MSVEPKMSDLEARIEALQARLDECNKLADARWQELVALRQQLVAANNKRMLYANIAAMLFKDVLSMEAERIDPDS